MKTLPIFFALVLSPINLSAQFIPVVNRTVKFDYDLNGNITSRKQISNSVKPGGESQNPTFPGDIDIINKGDLIEIDMKKDYGTAATIQVCDVSPVVLKSESFTTRTHTIDMRPFYA